MSDPVREPIRFIDERTAAAPMLRKTLRYLFPDNWSFLLGEVALYCFIVLIATGVYLALFFDPSTAKTVYHGPYNELQGREMSAAYKSVLDISFSYKAGLLLRQTHHWAADVFIAAMSIHLMRVFFTGAFRKPRELTWMIGLLMLFISLLEGYLGYSLADDLLSGMGLAIGYGVGLSLPIIGGPMTLAIFGAPFPGKPIFWSRMYIAHVFLIPIVLAILISVHLALVALRHHTQFRRSPRHTNRRLIGVPLFPGQTPRSLALMLFTAALLFLLGGLIQINPIWQWGPFEPYWGTNGAQPDWYLGWLIGALRLMPSFDLTISHFTLVPNPFWGGALFPLIVLAVLAAFPWIERRLTGDRAVHNLADRPRDAPNRTAFGVAFLAWVFLIFVFGSADRILVLWGISYNVQLYIFRIGIWVIPAVLFFVTRRWCRALQTSDRIEEIHEQAEHEAEEEAARRRAAQQPAGLARPILGCRGVLRRDFRELLAPRVGFLHSEVGEERAHHLQKAALLVKIRVKERHGVATSERLPHSDQVLVHADLVVLGLDRSLEDRQVDERILALLDVRLAFRLDSSDRRAGRGVGLGAEQREQVLQVLHVHPGLGQMPLEQPLDRVVLGVLDVVLEDLDHGLLHLQRRFELVLVQLLRRLQSLEHPGVLLPVGTGALTSRPVRAKTGRSARLAPPAPRPDPVRSGAGESPPRERSAGTATRMPAA
jgi:ubiquinol-cytochrome c reductase cytochrome b subunit